MIYLLDTTVVSALTHNNGLAESWLEQPPAGDSVETCVSVRGEVLFGLELLAPGRRRSDLEYPCG